MLEPGRFFPGLETNGVKSLICNTHESGGFWVPSDAISAALIRRLRTSAGISEEDIREIETLPITIKDYPAERPVVRDGERATDCCLVAEGFCMRSKTI